MGLAILLLLSVGLLVTAPAYADSLADAIQAGINDGKLDPDAASGFLGIPGGRQVSYVVGFFWAIWVGWIFSSVGAFGGIMAGVGHITVFGLGDYAKSFGKGHPLNKTITDSIRVSNQWLVGLSAFISSLNYYRMRRLVLPLGICLALGSILGSYLVPVLTAGKVNLREYLGYFGLIVLVIGGFLFFETTPRGQARKKAAKAAAAAFEKSVKEKKSGAEMEQGVKVLSWSPAQVRFTFFGAEFSFSPIVPVIGGLLIAAMASFIGVGGGFLFVPFLTSIAGLPMFLVAGTSALTVLVGMVISIATYMISKDVPVHWGLIGVELMGIFVGSMIGPRTSKYIPDIWLKRLFVVLALYVGIRYTTKGFLGTSWLPPF
jgi:uncharacterized membrane protein YfcA